MRHILLELSALIGLSWTAVQPVEAAAQDPLVADAVFAEPFTRIVGIRELSDGRLLVADRTERTIRFVDFASGRMREVARRGGGPGEYEAPGGLFALPDDAALLIDFGNMRLTRVTTDGRLDQSWSMITDDGLFIQPAGTDGEGRWYYSGAQIMGRGATTSAPSDSAPISRWDPSTNATDTVGVLHVSPAPAARRGSGFRFTTGSGATITGPGTQPFPSRDAWAVASDGRVAVVRAADYRVDWYQDGRTSRGPNIPYEPVRITRAEKEAWADTQAGRTMTMMMAGGDGRRGGRTIQTPRPDIDETVFPDVKPAFSQAHMTPDGRLWVERSQRHDESRALFDVFDGRGQRVRQVRLPAGRRVVGFGAGVLYAVVMDDDDLQWLERYAR